jgi:hypothetical protein
VIDAADPRWNWSDVTRPGQPPGTVWITGACRHGEVVPVESGDEVVARLRRETFAGVLRELRAEAG